MDASGSLGLSGLNQENPGVNDLTTCILSCSSKEVEQRIYILGNSLPVHIRSVEISGSRMKEVLGCDTFLALKTKQNNTAQCGGRGGRTLSSTTWATQRNPVLPPTLQKRKARVVPGVLAQQLRAHTGLGCSSQHPQSGSLQLPLTPTTHRDGERRERSSL